MSYMVTSIYSSRNWEKNWRWVSHPKLYEI